MRITTALLCSFMLACSASAHADEATCGGIKRALVSANLALMRIERGPLALAPVQASVAIGEMTALTRLAGIACSENDAGKIDSVVTPRVDGLEKLLPVVPAGATPAPAPKVADAGSPPPAPPSRPTATANARGTPRPSAGGTSCTRIYYMKGKFRYWRCKR
jgi:hypothetical protein